MSATPPSNVTHSPQVRTITKVQFPDPEPDPEHYEEPGTLGGSRVRTRQQTTQNKTREGKQHQKRNKTPSSNNSKSRSKKKVPESTGFGIIPEAIAEGAAYHLVPATSATAMGLGVPATIAGAPAAAIPGLVALNAEAYYNELPSNQRYSSIHP